MRRAATAVAVLMVLAAVVVVLAQPAWYLRLRYPLHYPQTIRAHAANYGLPPELVAAVIQQESRFHEHARSRAGAVGLMQLTPTTARGIASRTGGAQFREGDLLDPEINIRYGCWYLRHLHRALDTPGTGYDMALAAYNAGQGAVRKWIAADRDGHFTVAEIPFAETRTYVRRVKQLQRAYRTAYPRELGVR